MESPIRTKQWTRAEYDRLIEIGVFQPGDAVELLGGELVVAEPQSEAHDTAVGLVEDAGARRDCGRAHPARPVLVVEVSASSLALDRRHKGSLYARARLEDYWILNLMDRVLEVYRQPAVDASAPFGWSYASREALGAGAFIAPLAAPHASVAVAALLP